LRNENIGFIFQQFNLIPVLTALENGSSTQTDQPQKGRAERARHHGVKLVAWDRLHHLPRQLPADRSSAWRLRAPLSPTGADSRRRADGHLDAVSAQITHHSKATESEFGKTIVMVTHDPARRRTPRCCIIGEGAIDRRTVIRLRHLTGRRNRALFNT